MQQKNTSLFQLAVIVSALGFFVDVYDLLLFGIVRKPSLTDLGLSPAEVLSQGEFIISVQMIGLLVGGILWGIISEETPWPLCSSDIIGYGSGIFACLPVTEEILKGKTILSVKNLS